jgi:ABC-type molybdate transport system substrate-binding protein
MVSAKTTAMVSAVLAAMLVALLVWSARRGRPAATSAALLVYCAAGARVPVEKVAADYTRQYGVPVHVQYGGSGTLLSNLKVAQRGDLFIPADTAYLDLARSNQWVAETIPVARMRPVIAVAKGNPKGVRGVADLIRTDLAVALANPEAAAVGQVTREQLRRSGQWEAVAARVKVFKPTVNDLANDLKLGAVDAAVVWDATVRQYPGLKAIEDPVLAPAVQSVTVAVLAFSAQPTAALRFARFLAAKDRGLVEFEKAGFEVEVGDVWAEVPEVVVFSGGLNRLVFEPVVQRFEAREGVRVTRVYNGCGILVATMKSGQQPDAFLACDVSYLEPVRERFGEGRDISETDIVILVAKGNPQGIRALGDLGKPGLKVGAANPQQSTLGDLTVRLLRGAGVYDSVWANVRSQTPTADLLVNQIRTGSLDAAVVYAANATQVTGVLDVVRLEGPGTTAVQPYAIGRNSGHARLMERLLTTLRSAASRQHYEATGFRWRP